MATQSTLTITRADPTGSRPTGNLNSNWTESEDEFGTKFTAGTIMGPQLAIAAAGPDYIAYSEELCVGPLLPGTLFTIGNVGETGSQIKACWQWYNPATSGVDADFAMSADGRTGTFGNGTWVDIGTEGVSYATNFFTSDEDPDALAMSRGTMLRVRLSVTDDSAASDGVAQGMVDTAVAAVNTSTCSIPRNKLAEYNKPIVALYSGQLLSGSIGGLGADPS